eukprot:3699970-Pleurochrysis_carterae.AAC.1
MIVAKYYKERETVQQAKAAAHNAAALTSAVRDAAEEGAARKTGSSRPTKRARGGVRLPSSR